MLGDDHLVKSLPVSGSKPLRINDVERLADCFPRVESENAAGPQIPETNNAVGIAGDDGVARGARIASAIRRRRIAVKLASSGKSISTSQITWCD